MRTADQILLEERPNQHLVVLTLNRPAVRNALNGALLDVLQGRLVQIATEAEIGVVVVRGASGYFCSGGDLKERLGLPRVGEGSLQARSIREGNLLALIDRMPQLTLALVEGGAVGAGVGMLCACDLAIAAGPCHFAMPEILTGRIPAQIAPYLMRTVGWRTGSKLLLTGCRIDEEEAHRIGLIDELLSNVNALDQEISAKFDILSMLDARALAKTKELLRKATVDHVNYRELAAEAYVTLALERQ